MTTQTNPRSTAPVTRQTRPAPTTPAPTQPLIGPSVVECAALSNAVYNDSTHVTIAMNQTSTTWSRTAIGRTYVGFFAAKYTCPGKHHVIAFRGSQDGFDFLVDDLIIAAGGIPPQLISAVQFVNQLDISRGTYFTGHSLGGGLAVLSAAHFRRAAVSFNAPGVGDACVLSSFSRLQGFQDTVAQCATKPRVMNVRVEGDVVSSAYTTGYQVGNRRTTLRTDRCGTFDALCRHGMGVVLAEVRSIPAYYAPLSL